ncbi:MAG: hypothetical protein CMI13_12425 [Oleibacter sp.]|nr:hypothetical protein [Thalassolituus sp.]|tara:strand:- start:760 stop:1020 length:261 start_codon:yes stop_codon:yes gene_type:complete
MYPKALSSQSAGALGKGIKMDAFEFIMSVTEAAKSSKYAPVGRNFGPSSVLFCEFKGGVPFYYIREPGRRYEPTMSQIVAAYDEVA